MASKIILRQGLKKDLPLLDIAELGFCTDTLETFIGTGQGNKLLTTESMVISASTNNGFLSVNGVDVKVYDSSSKADISALNTAVLNLTTSINSKVDSTTFGAVALDVTNLKTTIVGKANINHTHTLNDITDIDTTSKVDGYVLKYNATLGKFVASPAPQSGSNVIDSSTNGNIVVNGIELAVYDDTSIKNSLSGKANTVHTHAISDVTNLQTNLDGKAAANHTHAIADVSNLQNTLNTKIDSTTLETRLSQESNEIITSITGGGLLVASGPEFIGSSNTTKTFTTDQYGFSITNDGTPGVDPALTFTINGLSFTVKAGEGYTGGFRAFRQVDIIAAVPFRAHPLDYISMTNNTNGGITPPADTIAPIVTISPNGGNFATTQGVIMSTNETATIYYTLDGSTPTLSSTQYASSIVLNATTTINYFAKDTAGNVSAIQSVVFTKDATAPADTTPPNDVTNLTANNITSSGVFLQWTGSTSTDISSYDVYNGTTPLGNTTANYYDVSGLSPSTQYTFKVKAKDTAGNISAGVTTIATTLAAPNTDTTPPTITVSPNGGTFTSAQNVILSANETATIFYTLDGSTPTINSLIYSSPITLNATTTINYFGKDTAGNSSTVQSAVFTINIPQGLNLSITDGLVSSYNMATVHSGITIPDQTSGKDMTMSGFTNGSQAYTDGGIKGDGTGRINSPAILATPGSFTFSTTYKVWNYSGNWNVFTLTPDLALEQWSDMAYRLRANTTYYSYGSYSTAGLYKKPAYLKPDTVTIVFDSVASTVTLYINGVKIQQVPYTIGSNLPTIKLFEGGYLPGSTNNRGLQTFSNAVFYNRVFTDQEVATLYNDTKRDIDPIVTTNYLTTVENGLIEAYDFTTAVPLSPPYHSSLIGSAILNFATVPNKAADNAMTDGAYGTYVRSLYKGQEGTFILKVALQASQTSDMFNFWGCIVRQVSITGGGRLDLKFSGATIPMVSITDTNTHTVAFTIHDNGSTGYDLVGYKDGVQVVTGTVTYAQAINQSVYSGNYPNVNPTTMQGPGGNFITYAKKYCITNYNRVLSSTEISQIHTDLMSRP